MIFEPVFPTREHAEIVMGWRNDPITLSMSRHGEPKELESFVEEFKRDYFTNHAIDPFFVVVEGQRVGFVRFTDHPYQVSCCEVSLNIAPEWRGKGIGTAAYKEAVLYAAMKGYRSVYAETKEENIASQHALVHAGFVEMESFTNEEGSSLKRYLFSIQKPSVREPVFIIAEAGSNWSDYESACRLIDVAANAGADAVKFQTFKAETLYVKNAGNSQYLAHSGINRPIFDIIQERELPYEFLPKLSEYCHKLNIEFMSTPFSEADFKAVDPYVKRHKMGSYEINHPHLLRLAAESQKPTYLSTGASTVEDIEWALETFYRYGGKEITLMQCCAQYPAESVGLNLKAIEWLRKRFGVPVGLSDHSIHATLAPSAAVALGAVAIEKHFTLDKTLEGPDHAFALSPEELNLMVRAIREMEVMAGNGTKEVEACEKELYAFACRGLQALCEIGDGEKLQEGVNYAILRPGVQTKGAHPKVASMLEGKKVTRTIPEGSGIHLKDIL